MDALEVKLGKDKTGRLDGGRHGTRSKNPDTGSWLVFHADIGIPDVVTCV